jgi:hypothetical protein
MPSRRDTLSPDLSSGGLESPLGRTIAQTRRVDATDAQRQRERELDQEPAEYVSGGRRKIPIRYE